MAHATSAPNPNPIPNPNPNPNLESHGACHIGCLGTIGGSGTRLGADRGNELGTINESEPFFCMKVEGCEAILFENLQLGLGLGGGV